MARDVQRRRPWAAAAVASTLALGGSLFLGVPAASAAADVITVTSLGVAGNAAAGTCEATAGAGDCTLRGALEIANASTNPDGVQIVFASTLAGTGQLVVNGGSGQSMTTTPVGNPAGVLAGTIGPGGARFVVDADVPVSIDFANLDGIDGQDGAGAAGFLVASDDVTLSNLAFLRGAEGGIAVSGSNVVIDDILISDTTTAWSEVGIALLDGASNVTISDTRIESMFYASIAVDTAATVSGISVQGTESRGVEAWAHVYVADDATVDGFDVTGSTFGAVTEISPTHGFFIEGGTTIDGLSFVDSAFHSPLHNGFYFEGAGQVLTNVVVSGSEFSGEGNGAPGYDGQNISRVIGDNVGTWDGLTFTDNVIDEAQAIKFGGIVRNAVFSGNAFTNVNDGAFAALHLGAQTEDVQVTGNTFDRIWAVDTIRVEGTSATNVAIVDNELSNLTASVSRSAIRIAVAGEGNVVSGNVLTQDISDTDPTLPTTTDNHWAIYSSASAEDATQSVGWTVTGNAIDGFGGKGRSQAPITHAGVGILTVTGNTFGTQTNGSNDVEVEEGGLWFLWNVLDGQSNDTVQTFRVGDLTFDGTTARFVAEQPDPEIGNNPATVPVTLHVYWTAADNAEEYLGAIEDVVPGQAVSIPTSHVDGRLRLQTVGADGFVSQYSATNEEPAVVVPAPPVVTETSTDSAAGTGTPGATVVIRDADGAVVAEVEVAEDGSWVVPAGLQCATDYTASQVVDEVEGAAVPFTTADCPPAPAAPVVTDTTTDAAAGTGTPGATVVIRDASGAVVAEVEVAEDGSWALPAGLLECGADYTAAQVVGGVEGPAVAFSTDACVVAPSPSPAPGTGGSGSLPTTGAETALWAGIAGLVLLLVGGAFVVVRRRVAQD